MHISHLLPLALATLTSAKPVPQSSPSAEPPFYLLSTTSASPQNVSTLPNVSLTSLYDPSYQPSLLLRLTAPGYNSVPLFTLTNGILHTNSSGPHGVGEYEYNSTEVHAGAELEFEAKGRGQGELGLVEGLVGVNGSVVGWSVCDDGVGERVIEWMGSDESCEPTYLRASLTKPY